MKRYHLLFVLLGLGIMGCNKTPVNDAPSFICVQEAPQFSGLSYVQVEKISLTKDNGDSWDDNSVQNNEFPDLLISVKDESGNILSFDPNQTAYEVAYEENYLSFYFDGGHEIQSTGKLYIDLNDLDPDTTNFEVMNSFSLSKENLVKWGYPCHKLITSGGYRYRLEFTYY